MLSSASNSNNSNKNNNNARPHVIGAGLGRTGTKSFKKALGILGVGPVFHMEDNFERLPDLIPYWQELAKVAPVAKINNEPIWPPRLEDRGDDMEKEARVKILSSILGLDDDGRNEEEQTEHYYHSSVDFPFCIYFMDLIDTYNNTNRMNDKRDRHPIKVVLTSRETGRKWANSALQTILNFHPSLQTFGIYILFTTLSLLSDIHQPTVFRYFPSVLTKEEHDVEMLANMHDTWNEYVRTSMKNYATVNGLKLEDIFLDYQVKEGWDPLCTFLEIDAKDCPKSTGDDAIPFPHINDSKIFQQMLLVINLIGYIAFVMIIGLLIVFMRVMKRVARGFGWKAFFITTAFARTYHSIIAGQSIVVVVVSFKRWWLFEF